MQGVPVVVMFVCDSNFDRQSASPETARLMVRSVRRYQPDWELCAGVVGEPPAWLHDEGVRNWVGIEPPDPVLRFMNKVETVRQIARHVENLGNASVAAGGPPAYGLFLDGDVLMCRPVPDGILTAVGMGCLGVHSDYPNVSTRDWVGRQVYGACDVRFPSVRARCTMYGGETWVTINVGAFWLRHDVIRPVSQLWLEHSHKVKDALRGDTRTFSEQTALMPTLDRLGVGYRLLNAAYNWNGTIYPTDRAIEVAGEDVVFLHYHRSDILASDPAARRVLAELENARAGDAHDDKGGDADAVA